MEYVQESVTTLHDLRSVDHEVPTDRAAIVVPMTEREYAGLAAERVFSELATLDPGQVIVPLRASAERVSAVREWLAGFDLDAEVLWCDGDRVAQLLADAGVAGDRGKGRDVWLGLGAALAGGAQQVVVHDADTDSYSREYVARLLFPLVGGTSHEPVGAGGEPTTNGTPNAVGTPDPAGTDDSAGTPDPAGTDDAVGTPAAAGTSDGFEFVKGYYARVEEDGLYGRLFRLFYTPLVRALASERSHPFLSYLSSFRYALAGEFAATRNVIEQLHVERSWGLEVGTLADAYETVGAHGTAQVDLGTYSHDHRSVSGPTGLSEMSRSVGETLFRAVERAGIEPEYESLPGRYRATADRLVRSYATDAAFNGVPYDPAGEREQVERYAEAIAPPGPDTRLPPWCDAPLDPESLRAAARADAEDAATSN